MRTSHFMKPLLGLVIAVAAACGPTEGDNFCIDDTGCNAGETCDVVNNTCGCTAAAGEAADSCTTADANKVCSPTTTRCIAKCTETSCGDGKQCNATTFLCEDDGSTDCTVAGQECATTDACNPVTKACETKCTTTSCGDGKVCHPTQFYCQATCIGAAANFCGDGKVCDATGLCLDGCTSTTCLGTEYCADDGYCETRCDAEGGALCQESEFCSAFTGKCRLKCNESGAPACEDNTVCAGSGLCIESCVVDGCAGDGFCNQSSGLCETPKDISECYDDNSPVALLYVDPTTNLCVNAENSDLDSCAAAANRDGSKPVSPNGPVIFAARQVENMSATELTSASCSSGVWVLFDYYDPSGSMFTSSGYSKVFFAATGNDANPALPLVYCVTGGDSKCLGVQGSTDTQGSFAAAFCRPAGTTDKIAVFAADTGSNHGNTFCAEVIAP